MTDSNDTEAYSLITKTRHRIELENCVEHLERFCRTKQSVTLLQLADGYFYRLK